ncbi:E3 ubiquitin-protein ligase PUB23-like [Curcuma longa]|uniref:E3 ubiquitin-protein ligase PUB23-like n=1 Tax=Curcuma longa TaxID=136217 RepID=UPI003D9EF4BD
MEEKAQVPSYFLCPISLQLMKDPVTLATGITYDRDSIQRWWHFAGGRRNTCPVSNQTLPDSAQLTPNLTLLRLIQAWHAAANFSDTGETPLPTTLMSPVDAAHVAELLDDAGAHPLAALRRLRNIVTGSEHGKRCVEEVPGAVDFLASVIVGEENGDDFELSTACDEALGILRSIQVGERGFADLVARNPGIVESLTATLRRRREGRNQSRDDAVHLLNQILGALPRHRLASLDEELFREVVRALQDRVSAKAALHLLVSASRSGRNRVKASLAGAVGALVEILLDEPERRACELALVAMDRACRCAEGRAELLAHAAGVAAVAKRMLCPRVSETASERAVSVLWSVARHAATPSVVREMMQVGAVGKLCLVLQAEYSGEKSKEKAREMLKWHAAAWRRSPCLSPHLQISYPNL